MSALNLLRSTAGPSSSRPFSSGSNAVLAKGVAVGFGARKQSPGFRQGEGGGRKKKIRREVPLSVIKMDSFTKRTGVSLKLPELHQLSVGPLLRNSTVAFASDKGSLINTFGIPKSLAGEITHLPQAFSVVRDVTLDSYSRMDMAGEASSKKSRFVLTGPRGCGKSITLLQIADYCSAQDWIVLYAPRAIDWINSTSTYQYDAQTRTFTQPALASETLRRFIAFNSKKLGTLTLSEPAVIEKNEVAAGTPLNTLAELGVQDPTIASQVLTAVLAALAKQTTVPVLLAVDDFQALYHISKYRDPLFHQIQSYHLSMPRAFLEYAAGLKSFARGAVVGALSHSNTHYQTPIELQDALQLTPKTSNSLWAKRNADLVTYTKGLQALPVPAQFNMHEAGAFYEVWSKSWTLHSAFNETSFVTKLAEASGNPREFLHKGFLSTLVTL